MFPLSRFQRSDSHRGKLSRLFFSIPALLLGSTLALSACSPSDVVSAVTGADPYADYYTPYGIIPSDDWINGYEKVAEEIVEVPGNKSVSVEAFGRFILIDTKFSKDDHNVIAYKWEDNTLKRIWEARLKVDVTRVHVAQNGDILFSVESEQNFYMDLNTGVVQELNWKWPFRAGDYTPELKSYQFQDNFFLEKPVFCETEGSNYLVPLATNFFQRMESSSFFQCAGYEFGKAEPVWTFTEADLPASMTRDQYAVLDLKTGEVILKDFPEPGFIPFLVKPVIFKDQLEPNFVPVSWHGNWYNMDKDFNIVQIPDESASSKLEVNPACHSVLATYLTHQYYLSQADLQKILINPGIPESETDTYFCGGNDLIGLYHPDQGFKKPGVDYTATELGDHLLPSPQHLVANYVYAIHRRIYNQSVIDNKTGKLLSPSHSTLMSPIHVVSMIISSDHPSEIRLEVIKAKEQMDENAVKDLSTKSENHYENRFFRIDIPEAWNTRKWKVLESERDINYESIPTFTLTHDTPPNSQVRLGGFVEFAVFPPGTMVTVENPSFEEIIGTTTEGYTVKIIQRGGEQTLADTEANAEFYASITLK